MPPKSIRPEIKPGGCPSMFLSSNIEQQTNILGLDLDLDKSHISSWTFPLTRLGSIGWSILFRGLAAILQATDPKMVCQSTDIRRYSHLGWILIRQVPYLLLDIPFDASWFYGMEHNIHGSCSKLVSLTTLYSPGGESKQKIEGKIF